MLDRDAVLFGTVLDAAQHFVGTRSRENDHQIRETELVFKIGRHLREYLGLDAEGLANGIDEDLIKILAGSPRPCCYAGGISSYDDIYRIKTEGRGLVNFTVGSKLDIFGGDLSIEEIIKCIR